MSSTILRQELLLDPLNRNYAAMTDAEVLIDLQDASRRAMPGRDRITDSDFYELLDMTEVDQLQRRAKIDPANNEKKADERRVRRLDVLLSKRELNFADDSNAVADLGRIFTQADSPQTRAAIQAYRTQTTSRAAELGLSATLSAEDIAAARVPDQPETPEKPA